MEKLFIVANWKMNGSKKSNEQLVNYIKHKVHENPNIEVIICPPFTYLTQILELKTSIIKIGAQNISESQEGAFTGEISGSMLQDMNIDYVIIGHSERRQMFNDTNNIIAQKFELAHQNNLIPILCVGESLNERKTGQTLSVVESQIKSVIESTCIKLFTKSIIAYEPVWAIGSGKPCSIDQVVEISAKVKESIGEDVPVVYGGSVNEKNVDQFFRVAEINGVLVGSASLDVEKFIQMLKKISGAN